MRQQRVVVILGVLAVGYLLIALQLVKLQVVEHQMWSRESERSTATFSTLPFERGWLLDRHGDPVARTEKVFDLVFAYRSWRRDSVAGCVLHAGRLLGGDVDRVRTALDAAPARLDHLAELRADDVARLEPRQRRADVLYYLKALFGPEVEEGFRDRLRAGGQALQRRLADEPRFAEALQRAHDRLAREARALPDLADVLGLSYDALLDGMEEAQRLAELRLDARVRTQFRRQLEEANPSALVDAAVVVLDASGAEVDAAAEDLAPTPLADEDVADYLNSRDGYAQYLRARRAFDDEPRRLQAAVPYDTQTLVTLRAREFPGFQLRPQVRRVYPSFRGREIAPLLVGVVGPAPPELLIGGERVNPLELAAAHVTELMDALADSEPNEDKLERIEDLRLLVREIDYRSNEEVGTRGLERVFEPVLRGKRGWVASRRDEGGRVVESMEPQRGLNVTLTLDAPLQAAAERLLDEIHANPPEPHGASEHWNASIVLLDPRDGDVLALATGPRPLRSEFRTRYSELAADPDTPLRHRGLRPGGRAGNLPPPGSLFKPVTTLAWRERARRNGTSNLSPLHSCYGSLAAGGITMACLGYHGDIGLEQAIARSCNVYFYELAASTQISDLYDYAERFGLTRPTGLVFGNARLDAVGIPRDPTGGRDGVLEETLGPDLAPAAAGKLVDRMSFAIGQRPLDDVTPLQVAVMTAGLATGRLPQASLVRGVEGYPRLPKSEPTNLGLDPRDLADVQDAMLAVVESSNGTAHDLTELFEEEPYDALRERIAAKTGTAEVGSKEQPDHAWVAGFLPREDPRLVFVVFLEHVDLHGSESAVPVLAELLRDPAVRAYVSADILGQEVLR